MKLLTAVIKPHKVDDVKAALRAAGVHGLTVTDVLGSGRQSGHTEVYRGTEYQVDLLPKRKIEVLCTDAEAEPVLDVLLDAARTGAIGDGKVWIADIAKVVRVRTGELDVDAI